MLRWVSPFNKCRTYFYRRYAIAYLKCNFSYDLGYTNFVSINSISLGMQAPQEAALLSFSLLRPLPQRVLNQRLGGATRRLLDKPRTLRNRVIRRVDQGVSVC